MHTKEQLVLRALRELGVVGAGQSASAEDKQAVSDEIPAVMDDLAFRGVWVWGDPDQIEDRAAVHLAVILANSIAPQFGDRQDEAKRLLAETRLRALRAVELSGQPQTTDYF